VRCAQHHGGRDYPVAAGGETLTEPESRVASRAAADYIHPVFAAPLAAVSETEAMRAEVQQDVSAIKQSVGLLRRHL
jgi:hypothetical protein